MTVSHFVRLTFVTSLVISASSVGVLAQDLRVCAVLPAQPLEGVEQSVADEVGENLVISVSRLGKFTVLPMDVVRNTLLNSKLAPDVRESPVELAFAVGSSLKADFVVVGHIEKDASGYSLVAGLADVRERKIIKTGKSKNPVDDLGKFVALAPKSMIDFLAGPLMDSNKAATTGGRAVTAGPTQAPATSSIEKPAALVSGLKAEPGFRTQEEGKDAPARFAGIDQLMKLAAGHLRLGTRINGFILLESEKKYFLGSIDKLNEEQNYWPTKVYADWLFNPNIGVELTWDELVARTATEDKADSPSHHDGDFAVRGPILVVFGRYPTQTRVTPYGGLGLGYMFGSFDYAAWWHLGYASEDDWVSAGGSSAQANGGKTRNMDIKDTVAAVALLGCEVAITDAVQVDLTLRYMNVTVKDHYYITVGNSTDDRGTTSIPLSNVSVGLGASYSF